MAENSKIEWTHHTFSPWRGCTKVSDGCKNCYAETLSKRNPATLGVWGDSGTRVVAVESYWKQPLKWNKKAECCCGAAGIGDHRQCTFCADGCQRPRVFCASLADVFEDRPELIEPRERLFALIDSTPNLDWLLLTKRPENIQRLWPFGYYDNQFMWPNIWLGTSVENQEQADKRIPELLKIPAAVRFLSCEPLLGPVNFLHTLCQNSRTIAGQLVNQWLHWCIVGGESGANARPMRLEWARSLRDQCESANVPFFFKQYGEWLPMAGGVDGYRTLSGTWESLGNGEVAKKVGKTAAGRLLDGREYNEFPVVQGGCNVS